MKRAAAIVMAAIMGIGMAGIRATSTTAAQNPQSITAYKKFLKHKKGYYKIVSVGNRNSVLLYAKERIGGMKKVTATKATVYAYRHHKVVKTGVLKSCGTAYPLARKGNYLVVQTHHTTSYLRLSSKGFRGVTYSEKLNFYTGAATFYKSNLVGSSAVKKVKISPKAGIKNLYGVNNHIRPIVFQVNK